MSDCERDPPATEVVKKSVTGFTPLGWHVYSSRKQNPSGGVRRGGNVFASSRSLVEFRSSERRWSNIFNSGYKHLTPPE